MAKAFKDLPPEQIRRACRMYRTNNAICKALGINKDTLYRWARQLDLDLPSKWKRPNA